MTKRALYAQLYIQLRALTEEIDNLGFYPSGGSFFAKIDSEGRVFVGGQDAGKMDEYLEWLENLDKEITNV